MQRKTIRPTAIRAPTTVARPGAVSSVGPSGAAPKPRLKNTRDYGKSDPAMAPQAPSPNPFGPTDGGSRIGGI